MILTSLVGYKRHNPLNFYCKYNIITNMKQKLFLCIKILTGKMNYVIIKLFLADKEDRKLWERQILSLKNPVIFADIFNKFLYQGKQVIKPENLRELDITEIVLPYGESGAAVPEQKYRDVLKLAMTDGKVAYCILGGENQNNIHYAMPVKNMVYDAMQLANQVTKATQSHRQKNKNDREEASYKASSDEYLSGFYKTDKLLPVVTLTIYWGPEKWDGPLTLKEMYKDVDDTILQYVPDYKVNLIAPEQMSVEEIKEFTTSLKEIMLYIKYSKDKTKLREVVQTNPEFKNLDRQAAEVINITTNSKFEYPEGKEKTDMCVAIEEMRKEGEMKGRLEAYKEVGFSFDEIVQHIADNYGFSLHEAEEKNSINMILV